MYTFIPRGVCSRKITFNIEDDLLKDVFFTGGCPGNLEGISILVEGMDVHEVINKLKGIKCGNKDTSCPDQLAKALEECLGVTPGVTPGRSFCNKIRLRN